MDANRNDFGESIEVNAPALTCQSNTVAGAIECDAELKETIAEDTYKNKDWGDPGKQHLTSAYND